MAIGAEGLREEAAVRGSTLRERLRASCIQRARDDPVAFVAMVLRDEETGDPIECAPMHEEWQDLITRHDRLVIWAHVEAAKTQQISIGRVLWEVGRNPRIRVCILSNVLRQAEKIVTTSASYILYSDVLHEIFPNLKPGTHWTNASYTVDRPFGIREPTVQATGVHGPVLGARFDLVVVDDVLDYENTRTEAQRRELKQWVMATLQGRLTANARLIVPGTAWHPDDLLHHYANTPGFITRRYPVIDEVTGAPRWPQRFPPSRIAQKRVDLGPVEFSRQMLCLPFDERTSRCQREWIDKCLARGEGKEFAFALATLPPGFRTITGVDLAVQQHASADRTVLFTIAVHPTTEDREIVCIERGRWAGPEIAHRIIDTHRRFNSMMIVENNAAQDWMLQWVNSRAAIPMRAFTTGRNKAHHEFGVESLFVEMSQAKWIIPSRGGLPANPEVDAFVKEALFYDPKAHTGDSLMAAWFAREGARMGQVKAEVGRLNLMRR